MGIAVFAADKSPRGFSVKSFVSNAIQSFSIMSRFQLLLLHLLLKKVMVLKIVAESVSARRKKGKEFNGCNNLAKR